jgi:hypothetical protein
VQNPHFLVARNTVKSNLDITYGYCKNLWQCTNQSTLHRSLKISAFKTILPLRARRTPHLIPVEKKNSRYSVWSGSSAELITVSYQLSQTTYTGLSFSDSPRRITRYEFNARRLGMWQSKPSKFESSINSRTIQRWRTNNKFGRLSLMSWNSTDTKYIPRLR